MKVPCVKRSRSSNNKFICKSLRNRLKNVKKRLQKKSMLKSLELQEVVVVEEEIAAVEVVMVTAIMIVTMINVHPVVAALDQLLQIPTVKSQSLKLRMKMCSIQLQPAPKRKHTSSRSKI